MERGRAIYSERLGVPSPGRRLLKELPSLCRRDPKLQTGRPLPHHAEYPAKAELEWNGIDSSSSKFVLGGKVLGFFFFISRIEPQAFTLNYISALKKFFLRQILIKLLSCPG